jgi:hypothetical protein
MGQSGPLRASKTHTPAFAKKHKNLQVFQGLLGFKAVQDSLKKLKKAPKRHPKSSKASKKGSKNGPQD